MVQQFVLTKENIIGCCLMFWLYNHGDFYETTWGCAKGKCYTTSTINFDSKRDILYVRMVMLVVTILPPFLNIFVHLNHAKLHNMIAIMLDICF
jgi:hypothetical protein